MRATANNKAINENTSVHGILRTYRQPNSIIFGSVGDFEYDLQGSPSQHLPKVGKFTYTGKAFTDTQIGDLHYTVDISNQSEQGHISNIDDGITLHQGKIQDVVFKRGLANHIHSKGIEAATSSDYGSSTYKLGFFGHNGEKIAGLIGTKEQNLGDVTNVAGHKHIVTDIGASVAFAGKRE